MSDTAVPLTKFLIWNFYNDLCALCLIGIFQYNLSVMLFDNTARNIKPHTKVHIRSSAFIFHKELFLRVM